MRPNTTDLQEPAAPKDVLLVLRNAADKYRSDASELNHAHQDTNAGKPWVFVATNLERLADVMEKRIKREGW